MIVISQFSHCAREICKRLRFDFFITFRVLCKQTYARIVLIILRTVNFVMVCTLKHITCSTWPRSDDYLFIYLFIFIIYTLYEIIYRPLIATLFTCNATFTTMFMSNARCNKRDFSNRYFHLAANGREDVLEFLLSKKASRDALCLVDSKGSSPAHDAAEYNHLGCLKMLLAAGLDVMLQDQVLLGS